MLHSWGKSAHTFLVGYSTYFKMLLVCHGSVVYFIQDGSKPLEKLPKCAITHLVYGIGLRFLQQTVSSWLGN